MNWYLKVLKQYFDFGGRARRKEYWMYTLFNLLALIAAAIIDSALGLAGESGVGPVYGLYALAVLIPGIAVSVRRLHDIDRSGWWLLILLIPLIGAIVLLVWACMGGTQGDNRFGPDPKADDGGAVPAMA